MGTLNDQTIEKMKLSKTLATSTYQHTSAN